MSINEVWDTIPEDMHNDIYWYVGESMNCKSKAFGPPPLVPMSFSRLNEEQFALVKWIRDCAYLEKVLGINLTNFFGVLIEKERN